MATPAAVRDGPRSGGHRLVEELVEAVSATACPCGRDPLPPPAPPRRWPACLRFTPTAPLRRPPPTPARAQRPSPFHGTGEWAPAHGSARRPRSGCGLEADRLGPVPALCQIHRTMELRFSPEQERF